MIAALFLVSGFAAILYQLVWQRVLNAVYGSDIESVTIVVTAFMVGLGAGSLAGGRLARRSRLPLVFASLELGVAAFGAVSVGVFRWVGVRTASWPDALGWLAALGLLLIPTILMGAGLPVLIAHFVRRRATIGRAVSLLYFTNTIGAAAGAFAAVFIVGPLGQHGSVALAASLNVLVGAAVLLTPIRREVSA